MLTDREIHALVDVTTADLSKNFNRRVQVAAPIGITVVRVEPAEVIVEVPPRPEPKIIISTNR